MLMLQGKGFLMAWFKVDDGFYTSEKFLCIAREHQAQAAGLWVLAGTWSADKMTDGFVAYPVLNQWVHDRDAVEQLIGVGLWVHDHERGGIQFHDWCEYQPTRESLQARAVERSEKNKANAAKRWDKSKPDANAMQTLCETDATVMRNDAPEPEPEPEPVTPNGVNTYDDSEPNEFDAFWELYPRKTGKGAAKRAYWKAASRFSHETILEGARRIASDPNLPEKQFIPHPATWLNEERWDDEPYSPRGKINAKQAQQAQAAERFLANFEQPKELTTEPDWA